MADGIQTVRGRDGGEGAALFYTGSNAEHLGWFIGSRGGSLSIDDDGRVHVVSRGALLPVRPHQWVVSHDGRVAVWSEVDFWRHFDVGPDIGPPPKYKLAPERVTQIASYGRKDDEGKPRFDLIPAGPLFELAKVYAIGASKYEDRNWEKGLSWGRVFGAMMRHAWSWWRGERHDAVDGQHHLASVAWCAFALMEYESTHPELDDRP